MGKQTRFKHICIIRPDIWSDADFTRLSCRARLLWLGLAGFVDCRGRAVFDPGHLVGQIFPGQAVPVDEIFAELRDRDLVTLYEVQGVTYIQMNGFARHQRVDRRRASRLPDRDGTVAAQSVARNTGPGSTPSTATPPTTARAKARNVSILTGERLTRGRRSTLPAAAARKPLPYPVQALLGQALIPRATMLTAAIPAAGISGKLVPAMAGGSGSGAGGPSHGALRIYAQPPRAAGIRRI